MAKPEEKTFVTNSEMLEQVLKNQRTLLFSAKGNKMAEERRIKETTALLSRD